MNIPGKISIRIGHDPYTDWAFLVGIAFTISCILIVAGFFSYASVGERLAAPPVVPAEAAPPLDQHALSELIDRLDANTALHTRAMAGYAGPADPSL